MFPRSLRKPAWFVYRIVWLAALLLAAWALYAGQRTFLSEFKSPPGSILPEALEKWMRFSMFLIPPLLASVAATFLSRARSDSLVPALLSLALLLISASELAAGNLWRGHDSAQAIVSGLGWLGLVIVLLLFPTGSFAFAWSRALAVAVAVIQLWLIARAVASATCLVPCGWLTDPTSRLAGYEPRFLLIAYLLGCAVALTARLAATPDARARKQIGWVLGGAVSAATLFSLYIYLTTHGMGPLGGWIISLAMIALPASFLVALLKYRLFEADLFMSRSAAFAVLTVVATALFIGLEAFINRTLRAMPETSQADHVIIALAALGLVTPMKGAVLGWADRHFRQDLTKLREGLPTSLRELRDMGTLDDIVEEVMERVEAGVRPVRLAIILDGKVRASRGDGADRVAQWGMERLDPTIRGVQCVRGDADFPLRVPLRFAGGSDRPPLGWLLLGPRPDGALYDKEEEAVLGEVAAPIARTVRAILARSHPPTG
jgi:hypothetical protein